MLTKKGKYGLKAMVHLAGRPPGEPSLVTDIATSNDIPKKFLDTILGELRNAGFVNSKKGKGGGYTLARSAQDIRVGHIIRVLDGPLAPIQCASKTAYRRCDDCVDEATCVLRKVLLAVRDSTANILETRTLGEVKAILDDHGLSAYEVEFIEDWFVDGDRRATCFQPGPRMSSTCRCMRVSRPSLVPASITVVVAGIWSSCRAMMPSRELAADGRSSAGTS